MPTNGSATRRFSATPYLAPLMCARGWAARERRAADRCDAILRRRCGLSLGLARSPTRRAAPLQGGRSIGLEPLPKSPTVTTDDEGAFRVGLRRALARSDAPPLTVVDHLASLPNQLERRCLCVGSSQRPLGRPPRSRQPRCADVALCDLVPVVDQPDRETAGRIRELLLERVVGLAIGAEGDAQPRCIGVVGGSGRAAQREAR